MMTLFKPYGTLPPRLHTLADRAFVVGASVLILMALLAIFWPAAVARSYLLGYTFWLNTSLGALGLLMLQHATGGAWGRTSRRFAEAAALTLPALAVLGIPLLLMSHYLYPWANADIWSHDPIQAHRRPYFDVTMVFSRAAISFVIWIALAWSLRWASRQQDQSGDHPRALALAYRMRYISQGGMVLMFITVSLVGVDWIMSREPHWVSSIFGLVLVTGEALSGMTWIILTLYTLSRERNLPAITSPERVHDLGKLLLTTLVLWGYMMFSQYLIIWLGNTQTDIPWFVHRTRGGWQYVGAVLIFLGLLAPLFLLLSRRYKRHLSSLAAIALGIWVLRWIDTLWLIAPSTLNGDIGHVYLTDLLAPIGLSGVWIGLFLRYLDQAPLFPSAYVTSGANESALIVKGAADVD